MDSTTAQATISVLNTIFSRYGFPDKIISDNGPSLLQKILSVFCQRMVLSKNYVPHITQLAMA